MAACVGSSNVIAIKLLKCDHHSERQLMKAVKNVCTPDQIFHEIHGAVDVKRVVLKYEVSTALQGASFWEVCFEHFCSHILYKRKSVN
jgi:hypothetical protein